MHFTASSILAVLDQCDELSTFPMLDNGYLYLAANRLSLHRSQSSWAIVTDVFGFSPRAGLPDLHIYTFANQLHNRKTSQQYVTIEAYEKYLARNPHNESYFFYPIDDCDWQDEQNSELVAESVTQVVVRGKTHHLPALHEYGQHGVELEKPPRVYMFELCRFLAAVARDDVLATSKERRISVLPDMAEVLRLEEWHHPDIADGERPSSSETFQQLADVLVSGGVTMYRPSQLPNTHWRNWPEGGTL